MIRRVGVAAGGGHAARGKRKEPRRVWPMRLDGCQIKCKPKHKSAVEEYGYHILNSGPVDIAEKFVQTKKQLPTASTS